MKTKVHEVVKVLYTHTHTDKYYVHLETKSSVKTNEMEYINLAKG